jgi:hypothetical protein
MLAMMDIVNRGWKGRRRTYLIERKAWVSRDGEVII